MCTKYGATFVNYDNANLDSILSEMQADCVSDVAEKGQDDSD